LREVRVVVNAVAVRGTSLGVMTENLLKGWLALEPTDDLHVVADADAGMDLPAAVSVHDAASSRITAMERQVPALCRELRADAMLGVTPATTMAPLPCIRGVIALDLRHEQLPDQFGRKELWLRKISYAIGYQEADAIACISHRIRDDLVAGHPFLARRRVVAALLGSDHVLDWPAPVPGDAYALAFGQWGNKNADLVLDTWALLASRGAGTLPLVVVGVPDQARAALEAQADALGLRGLVTIRSWLTRREFQQTFSSASLVVFPSDYEGFGLPPVEAMRLGIPVVVTPERTLLEVTAGLATVTDGWDAPALADAVDRARATSPEDLDKAQCHAATYTWRATAEVVRHALADAIGERNGAAFNDPR
jgi:glycosyltransferase involved in cell wall biosynthesis